LNRLGREMLSCDIPFIGLLPEIHHVLTEQNVESRGGAVE